MIAALSYSSGGGALLTTLAGFDEAEWDLAGSFPLRPVFEYGVRVGKSNVMELGESNILWQVPRMDEVALGLLHSSPWDSALAPTHRNI